MTIRCSNWFNRTICGNAFYNDWSGGILYLYKGTMPSGEITQWSTYRDTRTSDLLATLSQARPPSVSLNPIATYFDSGKPVPAPATTAGTVTWAAWQRNSSGGAVIGKVTEPGGDGLFILEDTAVTTGANIVVVGFRMQW